MSGRSAPGAAKLIATLAAVLGTLLSGAAAAKAPARRYQAAGGVVTDTMTRLAWQQLVGGQRFSYDDAGAYCRALDLKGTGWRVPTIKELLTLVDETSSPAIDPVFLPTTDPSYVPDAAKGTYWSATRSASYASEAWQLSFSEDGAPFEGYMPLAQYVRCVR